MDDPGSNVEPLFKIVFKAYENTPTELENLSEFENWNSLPNI